VNPNPESPGRLTLAIDEADPTAKIDLVLNVCDSFRLSAERARAIVKEVEAGSRPWREIAARNGIPAREIATMKPAFETPQREVASAL
jgi:hypothetical protein